MLAVDFMMGLWIKVAGVGGKSDDKKGEAKGVLQLSDHQRRKQ